MSSILAGWYPDPDGKPCEKYWDGTNWTTGSRPQSGKARESVESPVMTVVIIGGFLILSIALIIGALIFGFSDPYNQWMDENWPKF